MISRVLSAILWSPVWILSLLIFSFIFDAIASTVYYIIWGDFSSVIQMGLMRMLRVTDIFWPYTWQINSGLKGLDQLVNGFMGLQYSTGGRFRMLLASLGLCIISFIMSLMFKSVLEFDELEDTSHNEWPLILSFSIGIAFTAPLFFCGFLGWIMLIIDYLK